MKIKKLVALMIVFFSWVNIIYANFEITEIMYNLDGTDAKREWVEVKNISSEPVDFSKWYFFSDNTKHSLNPIKTSIVEAGAYAVITQNEINFINDWPNYSGLLFDSSWTDFNNKGESIALKNSNLEIISPISFSSNLGGAGNGNSLQRVNNIWQESKPTPGAENKIIKVSVIPIKSSSLETSSLKESLNNKNKENIIDSIAEEDNKIFEANKEIINLNDLNKNTKNINKKIPNSIYTWIGLGLIIFIGVWAVILMRHKNYSHDILEKEIRPEDIKIIE